MSDVFQKHGQIISEVFDIWKGPRISKKNHNRAKNFHLPENVWP